MAPNQHVLVKAARKLFAGCLNCGKSIWPFRINKKDNFRLIRCEHCHRKLSKVWFDNYHTYIDTFKGQL